MARDYNAAISALNTLQTNFAIVDAIRKSGRGMNKAAIPEMLEWCKRIGYEPTDLNRINPIHIAGTKGKGSTSAFISSIFAQYNGRAGTEHPQKIGLYTSPHLRSVRERIQINNEPLSEELFTHYFFSVWDRLEQSAEQLGPMEGTGESKPVYFRFLTLMAFHAYVSEGVDTAIFECGVGGEYDSTNVFDSPTVCGVTSLDIDHTAMLGDTIESIAWHKAGIFKNNARCRDAFTVAHQPGDALKVLEERASEKGMKLRPVQRQSQIGDGSIKLGLAADFQKTNASLAVAIAAAHLKVMGARDVPDMSANSALPAEFKEGLEKVQWGGRCETRKEKNITWHIDGGHTMESIRLASQWFASCISSSQTSKPLKRALFFNQQTRDAKALARGMHTALSAALTPSSTGQGSQKPLFSRAIFSTNVTFATPSDGDAKAAGGHYKPDLVSMNTSAADVSKLTVQKELATVWQEIDSGCNAEIHASIEEAVNAVRKMVGETDEEVMVLVTGSLHLVGGVLEVLETSGVHAERT